MHKTESTLQVAAITLALLLGNAAAAAAQDETRQQPTPTTTHEFQITLIRARPGQVNMPDLAPDALEALRDVAHLLPYEDFELLDVGWMRTDGTASVRMGEAASFEAHLNVHSTREAQHLLVPQFVLYQREFERDEEGRVHYGDTATLLGNSFGITIGETVVVGTSRLSSSDEEALIVLLKAVR